MTERAEQSSGSRLQPKAAEELFRMHLEETPEWKQHLPNLVTLFEARSTLKEVTERGDTKKGSLPFERNVMNALRGTCDVPLELKVLTNRVFGSYRSEENLHPYAETADALRTFSQAFPPQIRRR